MDYTYEQLHKMTIADLREIAKGIEHEAVQGYSQLHKEQLLPAICQALGIEAHAHHEVVGINKSTVKRKIRGLKEKRSAALEAHDHTALKRVRRQIHSLKRRMHQATV
jgi:DNA-binding IclR family transcriptional regulator